MYSLAFLGITSFLICLFLTPLVRNAFRRMGIVDHPGDARRLHDHPIPRVGGIAIALSCGITYFLLYSINPQDGYFIPSLSAIIIRVFPSAGLIFVIGLFDDIVGLKPWQKLVSQVAAASVAFVGGVHVGSFGGHAVAHWLTLPLTIAWLVICTNALNLIDGIDGLAAGVGLFATFTTMVAALLQHNVTLALATAPLACALLGFLRYNFNPATIFLGDSGSLFIGFLLGCYGILWSQKAATIFGMTAPLFALAVPLLDTALAIARRFLRHQPIFGADRGHIHHRLLDHGFTPRKAALVLYACCCLGAVASLLMMNRNFAGMVFVTFCIIAWIGIQHLGYIEFGIAGRMFIAGGFRRQINDQVALCRCEQELIGAATPDTCWAIIKSASAEFGFHDIEMQLCGVRFQHRNGLSLDRAWNVRIPISATDYVELTREFGNAGAASTLVPFADILRRTLAPKLPVFEAFPTRPQRIHVIPQAPASAGNSTTMVAL